MCCRVNASKLIKPLSCSREETVDEKIRSGPIVCHLLSLSDFFSLLPKRKMFLAEISKKEPKKILFQDGSRFYDRKIHSTFLFVPSHRSFPTFGCSRVAIIERRSACSLSLSLYLSKSAESVCAMLCNSDCCCELREAKME